MQVEWNQYDGLTLARDRRMTHKPVIKFFITKEKVTTDRLLTHLGTISTLMKLA